MKVLYEILIPTIYGNNLKPISTKHHKQWDKYVQSIAGGLTILSPGKGKWIYKGVEYPERVIPVRVMIETLPQEENRPGFSPVWFRETKLGKIIQFTLKHYRQKAVMYYVVSNEVNIVYAEEQTPACKICGKTRNMIKHGNEWVCHETHRID